MSEFTRYPKLPDFTLMHFCLSFQGCDYSHQLTTKVHRATENPISMEPTPILHSTMRHITRNVLCDINCLNSVNEMTCGPWRGRKVTIFTFDWRCQKSGCLSIGCGCLNVSIAPIIVLDITVANLKRYCRAAVLAT